MTILLPGTASPTSPSAPERLINGWQEIGFLALLYVAYAASRVLANDSLRPARERAMRILSLEDTMLLDVERDVVAWFVHHDDAGLLASYYYAAAHYLVTATVLVWLFHRRRSLYPRARWTLVGSTVVALAGYLFSPTAPPRLVGFDDLLARHADGGWWGEAASAPQGLGWMTNQLAAFPSMHAGWALWVALVIATATTSRLLRTAGWAHAIITVVVVVGTGNHWVLDVVAGWMIVFIAWRTTAEPRPGARARRLVPAPRRPQSVAQPAARRERALRTRAPSVVVHMGGSEAARKLP